MSKRYGRRQKRAHRAAIVDMMSTMRLLHDSIFEQRMANELLRRRNEVLGESIAFMAQRFDFWDSEISALLGRYSSARITPATFRVSKDEVLRKLHVDSGPISLGALSSADFSAAASVAYYVQDMLNFVTQLSEPDLMSLRHYLTVRVKRADAPPDAYAAYAFSEAHWRDLKVEAKCKPEAFQRHIYRIAEEFMDVLTRPKKKEQAHGGSGLRA